MWMDEAVITGNSLAIITVLHFILPLVKSSGNATQYDIQQDGIEVTYESNIVQGSYCYTALSLKPKDVHFFHTF